MLSEEFGLQPVRTSAFRASVVTFGAFLAVGFLPIGPFLFPVVPGNSKFTVSAVLAAVAFVMVGMLRGRALGQSLLRTGAMTLLTGGAAAVIGYVVAITGARLNSH